MQEELIHVIRTGFHFGLHGIFPGFIAWRFFGEKWKLAWAIMAATIIVDLDHSIATPMYDSLRCSIGFHPLHSYIVIFVYILALCVPNFYIRAIAVGVILHMMTDAQDCLWIIFGVKSLI